MAASQAHELGFDAVLCVAAELDIAPPNGTKYKKIPIGDGAHNVIPEVDVKEAIRWIDHRYGIHSLTYLLPPLFIFPTL